MYTCEVVLKTVQETRESVGIIGKFWRFLGEIQGKFGENWGIVFPPWGNNIPWRGNQFPPCRRKGGKMRENCFTKITIWGLCVK